MMEFKCATSQGPIVNFLTIKGQQLKNGNRSQYIELNTFQTRALPKCGEFVSPFLFHVGINEKILPFKSHSAVSFTSPCCPALCHCWGRAFGHRCPLCMGALAAEEKKSVTLGHWNLHRECRDDFPTKKLGARFKDFLWRLELPISTWGAVFQGFTTSLSSPQFTTGSIPCF